MSIRKRNSRKAKKGFVYEVYFNYTNIYGIPSRYSKSGFITKKQAEDHETEKKNELLNYGIIKKEVKLTLDEVYKEFIEVNAKLYQDNTIINSIKDFKYVSKELGAYPIVNINYGILQVFFNNRSDKGIETNKNIRKALKRVIVYAIQSGYIDSDPLAYVKITGVENKREKKALDLDDFDKIIKILESKNTFRTQSYIIAMKLGYYCGLRVSEVCALEKSDFDLINRLVSINKKLVYYNKKVTDFKVVSDMKSKGSKATIPLPQPLINDLQSWFSINPYDIVICSEEGSYINPAVMYRFVRKIAKRVGIDYNFHMLRHTYATNLVMNNANIKTAQELMRHSSADTTLSVYTHASIEQKIETIDKIFNSQSVEKVSKTQNTKILN